MTLSPKANPDARTSWVQLQLASLPTGGRILDAGAGKQPFRSDCAHLRYVAQDFGRYDGAGNGSGLQTGDWTQEGITVFSDITAIPEPDGAFDAVLCTEVFEHIPDPIGAIREFARLTRPGGHLILTAPFCSLTHYAPYHFYSGFSRYFYETHLNAAGFDIVETRFNGGYFDYLAQELRRLPEVAVRYAHTRLSRPQRWLLRQALKLVLTLAARDRGSSELLTFGLHIHAVRRDTAPGNLTGTAPRTALESPQDARLAA